MIASPSSRFSYRDADHSYWLGDQRLPSITQIIKAAGLIHGEDFMTEESRRRGQVIHDLCARWALGALDVSAPELPYRPYVLGFIAASTSIRAEWEEVEEAAFHPEHKFAGRIDLAGVVFGQRTIAEIKSGGKASYHAIQTAAQAILKAHGSGIRPEDWQRIVIYLKPTGKFLIESHDNRRDFDEAYRLIKEFAS